MRLINGKNSYKLHTSKHNFLVTRKKRIGVLLFILVISLFLLFFVVLNFGANLYKMGQATYLKNTVLQIAKLDFSFIKNYTVAQFSELDDIQLDIKFKHLQRIRYLRREALHDDFISQEIKSEDFPGQLSMNGKTHDVKISLTGLVASSHLGNPEKWSFEVKVKGDDTFKGMKRFGMLLPTTRGFMTDWMGLELMKERGLIGLRVDYVHLTINGKPNGVYYLEERFDKYLLENNRLREGIIFKLDKELSPYQESKLLQDPTSKDQLEMIKVMWQDVMAGDLPPSRFFDMKKMAQLFVICDLMNNKHPLSGTNMRFYFNPVTSLVEPIAREWEKLEKGDLSNLRLFLEKPIPFTRHDKFANDPILKIIYDNFEFKRQYVIEAEILCQTKFLDEFFIHLETKTNTLINKVYRFWPYYDLPKFKLYENQNYMRQILFPKNDQLKAFFSQRIERSIQISLYNQQYLPLEVSYLSWRDSMIFLPEKQIVLDTKEKEQPHLYNFELPEGIQLTKDYINELKVHFNVYGLTSDRRTIDVNNIVGESRLEIADQIVNNGMQLSDTYFLKLNNDKEIITIPAGEWKISKDLIIPFNRKLEFEPGSHIDLVQGAGLISYSPIFMNGEKNLPIHISSSDSSSMGIYVIQANQKSHLSHVIFDNLAGPKGGKDILQGSITFFESPVEISNCTFTNGKGEKDYLHISHTELLLNHCVFKNIKGNGLGLNYCNGTISNSSFVRIENNGISTYNSNLRLSRIFCSNILANSLLARDKSDLSLQWARMINSDSGIAASGQSVLSLFDIHLENNHNGIIIFEENSGNGNVFVDAKQLNMNNVQKPYQITSNAKILLDGKPLDNIDKNMIFKNIRRFLPELDL